MYDKHMHSDITDLWMTDGPGVGFNGTVYEEEMFGKHVMDVSVCRLFLIGHGPWWK